MTTPKNTICLWFDKDALDAANFYAATFPDSEVTGVHRAPGDFPSGKKGDVLTVQFTVLGIPCLGLNGGPAFKQSEAFSFQIATDDQEETDRYWNAIVGNGGKESDCGWCKDRWGLSWQITPRVLTDAPRGRRRRSEACLRRDDDDAENRRREDRGSAAGLTAVGRGGAFVARGTGLATATRRSGETPLDQPAGRQRSPRHLLAFCADCHEWFVGLAARSRDSSVYCVGARSSFVPCFPRPQAGRLHVQPARRQRSARETRPVMQVERWRPAGWWSGVSPLPRGGRERTASREGACGAVGALGVPPAERAGVPPAGGGSTARTLLAQGITTPRRNDGQEQRFRTRAGCGRHSVAVRFLRSVKIREESPPMRKSAVFVVLVCLCLVALPGFAEEKESTAKALGKAAGAKIGEAAAKWVAGKLYDSSCVNVNNDAVISYVCDVMRGFSGRDESEWKAKIETKLNEISSRLDTIEQVQREMHNDLMRNYRVMDAKIDQVAGDVLAVEKLVRIEGLWEKYQTQFDKVDADVTKESMVSFAKEIIANEPHSILTQLNVLLTNPPKGQPIVKYPFYEWRVQNQTVMGGQLNANEIYDFAEKKFIEYRGRQQKAYAMYYWAAAVLETQCQFNPRDCVRPPRPLKDFQADYERYTRLQAKAFNSAVDWFLLSYAFPRADVQPNFLPNTATDVYLRANLVTSAILGEGGLWGRVISMGKAWDGSLQVTCGGTTRTLTPVLEYTAPVGGNGMVFPGPDDGRPLDWWVSTANNSTYDEVHFSDSWQVYHYSLPSAPAGQCTVAGQLPKGGVLPWVNGVSEVVDIDVPGIGALRGGSFLAIQRAGGNYALVSGGSWVGSTEPEKLEEGSGSREQEYTWMIEPDHPQGPWIGLRVKGKANYLPKFFSRIRNRHRILLAQQKDVRFPEGGAVKLLFFPGNCGTVCDGDASSIVRYDIPNNDTESKKGKLVAKASILLAEGSIPDLPQGGGVLHRWLVRQDRRSPDEGHQGTAGGRFRRGSQETVSAAIRGARRSGDRRTRTRRRRVLLPRPPRARIDVSVEMSLFSGRYGVR